MSKLKIVYILSVFPAFTETFIIREIREIRRRGIDVQVFSLKNPRRSKSSHYEASELYDITHYVPYVFSLEIYKSLFYFLRTKPICTLKTFGMIVKNNLKNPSILAKSIAIVPKAIAIAKTVMDGDVRSIHAHWATIPATAAWIISRLSGKPFTFTTHAWDIFKADDMLEQKMRSAYKVITISEFNKTYLHTKFPSIDPEKIIVIHTGLEFGKFKPKVTDNGNIFRILSVGRLVETKGFQFLLKACHLLRERDVPFHCQIVYVSDKYESNIFKLYKELDLEGLVKFIPGVPQEKILDYYLSADCFVLPCTVDKDGDRDGIPTVILEALATALPVITTPVSGIPEVIHNNETGLLVEQKNAQELADAIERVYFDKELRERLGRAGRDIVHNEFEISSSVDRLLNTMLS